MILADINTLNKEKGDDCRNLAEVAIRQTPCLRQSDYCRPYLIKRLQTQWTIDTQLLAEDSIRIPLLQPNRHEPIYIVSIVSVMASFSDGQVSL